MEFMAGIAVGLILGNLLDQYQKERLLKYVARIISQLNEILNNDK